VKDDSDAADRFRHGMLWAWSMSSDEKLREGFQLFDRGRERVAAVIRSRFPHMDEAAVKAIVDRAVKLVH
jgi:hypothetical protein